MQKAEQLNIQQIDYWQRRGEINKILEYTDSILLRDGLGMSEHEIGLLHSIWNKMSGRRVMRKKITGYRLFAITAYYYNQYLVFAKLSRYTGF